MRIQHNIMAMNAYRNYNNNVNALSSNLEKLSSGYRINRAGDDAAGLAISEKMRAQITGLDAAQKNVQDGVSLVKTAEGALQEVQDMLNRMVYLATQSANGTYEDEVDRENLQAEVNQLRDEINRIADSANFNGRKLLDGSLDENATGIGATTGSAITIAAAAADQTDPTAGTILHSNGKNAAKTSFDVELHNVSITARDGDTIGLKIGNDTISLTVGTADEVTAGTADVAAGTLTGSTLTSALQAKFAAAAGNNNKIDGEAFTATANGSVLSFAQNADPATSDNVVSANLAVKLTHTSTAADATVDLTSKIASVNTTAGTDSVWNSNTAGSTTLDTNVTLADTDVDETKLLTAINAANKGSNGAVSVEYNSTSKTVDLISGGKVIASSQEITDANKEIADSGSLVLTFTSKENVPVGLGTMTISNSSGGAWDVTSLASKDTSWTTQSGVAPETADVSFGSTANITAAVTAAGADAADADLKVVYEGNKYKLMAGTTQIGVDGVFGSSKVTFKDADGNTLVELDGTTGTTTDAEFQTALTTAVDLGADYKAAVGAGEREGTWNIGTTNNVQGNIKESGNLASTYFTLTADMVKDGQTITLGDQTYTFAVGSGSTVDTSGTNVVNLTEVAADATDLVDKAGEALSKAADANATVFTVGYDMGNDRVTIHEVENQTKYVNGELESVESFAKLFGFGGSAGTSGSVLTLQIGDTSDKYNQLEVSVQDMHAKSLGTDSDGDGIVDAGMTIADIDITNIEDANKAIDVIKNAINMVSSQRGDLGAIQNRLEHTANNLSVMEENITNAESAIRDTDVADEMMAYTKNNILIQSAQAMLAQANAVPQGVLQLLQ